MRCEKFTCSLRYNCKLYLSKSNYKLIIENPNRKECKYHQPLEKIQAS